MYLHALSAITGRANGHQKATRTTGQRDRRIEVRTDRDIISTRTNWGPSDTSVGIYASRCLAPIQEINTNTKIEKLLQTTGRIDGRAYYTSTQVI